MKIFLSYASQDREAAKTIYLALRDQGQTVFFDRADLPAGEEYHNRIREAIENSALFIFLISPNAIDGGSYTLTELDIAGKTGIKLLPVMLRETELVTLPASIKSVTFLQTDGSMPGAVAAEVHRIAAIRRWRRLKLVAAAAAGVVFIGASLFYGLQPHSGAMRIGKDGAPAILISGGSFVMGDDENSPQRTVFVDAFYMDNFEITVGRYAKFLEATGSARPPEEWESVKIQTDSELPVVGVNWGEAAGYCKWAGKRLPTEAEWERAARGKDERKYPWGNDAPAAESARYGKRYENPVYQDGVARVGSYAKDSSPFGVFDLAGNVTEWVGDWFSDSVPVGEGPNPKGPESGTSRVLRGGSWYDPAERIQVTKRWHASPANRSDGIGFRCAADAK
jgi:formylglycine-generating enzyme required for sulfatase activity